MCLNSRVGVGVVSMIQNWQFIQQNRQKLAIAHSITYYH
ncbi:hypothetical protein COO91_10732 (plasmid) [Nostoc flagelliforme CCNUN1]|uniref:Uncharacterized protein n=1 Tax=Nostoc flagelliforme CCNUN1 TaxID=2038116 RepID=A0A2K8TA90_9NOSO|nr:hypothetical protein COO91_10732 [Nostoc flagelliforme CCNUN1]